MFGNHRKTSGGTEKVRLYCLTVSTRTNDFTLSESSNHTLKTPHLSFTNLCLHRNKTHNKCTALQMAEIVGLIYQSNVETSADPSAQINLRQSSRVIYETFVCRQSHRTKDRTLINVAAENNRRLNITPLKTPRFRSLAPKVYDTEKHNPAKKRK